MTNKITNFVIALIFCSLLTSCHITMTETTRCLWERGVVYESISPPKKIIKSRDGELAAQCIADYSYKNANIGSECILDSRYSSIAKRERFVVIDKAKMFDEINRQIELCEKLKREKINISITCCIKEFVPDDFNEDDVELYLPEKFKKNKAISIIDQSVPYKTELKGKVYDIYFGDNSGFYMTERTYRRWWGYPLLGLTPVTLVIDISSTAILIVAVPIILPIQLMKT